MGDVTITDAPGLIDEPTPHPDAQATVTDYLDYTEFFPSDLVRSLTLIRQLDSVSLDANAKVHELTTAYGGLPNLPANERPDPIELRKQISAFLDRTIQARESAYAEATRLYDVAERHCTRLASIKRKLQALPQPPSRDPTPAPVSPQALRRNERTPRITLHIDGARRGASVRPGGTASRPKHRVRRVIVPGEVLPPPNPDSPPPSSVTDWESPRSSPARSTVETSPQQRRPQKVGAIKIPKSQRVEKKKTPKPPRARPPGTMGTNAHSSVAGISTSNALAKLTPPPPDAKPGSKFAPWHKLTDYEMAALRKSMKKNAIWVPSDTMIRRELARKGRGRENYEKAKKLAEETGEPFLDEDPIDPSKTELAPGETNFKPLDKKEEQLVNRGMKLNEAKKQKKEVKEALAREQREQAARDALDIEEASKRMQNASDTIKKLFDIPPMETPKRELPKRDRKRKRDSTPERSKVDTAEVAEGLQTQDGERVKRIKLTATPLPIQPPAVQSPVPLPSNVAPLALLRTTTTTMTTTTQVPLAAPGPSTPASAATSAATSTIASASPPPLPTLAPAPPKKAAPMPPSPTQPPPRKASPVLLPAIAPKQIETRSRRTSVASKVQTPTPETAPKRPSPEPMQAPAPPLPPSAESGPPPSSAEDESMNPMDIDKVQTVDDAAKTLATALTEQVPDMLADTSAEMPMETGAEKPVEKAAEKSAGEPVQPPVEAAASNANGKPTDSETELVKKPVEEPVVKADKPGQKPMKAEKASKAQKPTKAEKPKAEKPTKADKPAERPLAPAPAAATTATPLSTTIAGPISRPRSRAGPASAKAASAEPSLPPMSFKRETRSDRRRGSNVSLPSHPKEPTPAPAHRDAHPVPSATDKSSAPPSLPTRPVTRGQSHPPAPAATAATGLNPVPVRTSGRVRTKKPAPGQVSVDEDGKGKVSVGRRKAAPKAAPKAKPTGPSPQADNEPLSAQTEPKRRKQQKSEVEKLKGDFEGDEGGWEDVVDVDPDEPRYCICSNVSYGTMIACENDDCEKEWFHLACVRLEEIPPRRSKWYCPECREKLNIDEKGHANPPPAEDGAGSTKGKKR